MLLFTLINGINLVLASLLLALATRYFFSLYREGIQRPEEWAMQLKAGKIRKELNSVRRGYKDQIRFYAFWLQCGRILRDQVKGSVAEVGVYKGDTALILHQLFPDRALHLFDTFEGFPASDLKEEKGKAAEYTTANFSDTSYEAVHKRLGNSTKLHFHPGYFPETTIGLEQERFCMVSLDADLYLPTRAALQFFYPRMSPGGVIFVHDYNSNWEGLRKAVDEFVKTIPEGLVLLPDQDTTAMIIKS